MLTLEKSKEGLLNKKLKSGGIVVMHDTESYRHSSGSMAGYGTGDPYPPEIKENIGKGMREALEEEVAAGHYKIIRETEEANGAAAIMKI